MLVISLHSLDCAVALDIGSKRSVPMSSSLEAFGGLKGLGIDLSGTGGTPGLDACMQAPTQEELLLQRLLQDDPGPCLAASALQGVDEAQRRVALAHRGVSLKNDPLHIGQHYDGHGGEALGLAITLATILPSIRDKGGEISAIVVDSMNFAANLTTAP